MMNNDKKNISVKMFLYQKIIENRKIKENENIGNCLDKQYS